MGKLDTIQRNSAEDRTPPRLVLYGTAKIGKTTFAANAPSVLFLPTEDGLTAVTVDAVPLITSFDEFMEYLDSVLNDDHEYRSLAIDSLDYLDRLIQQKVCDGDGVKSIEDIGYGAGYKKAEGYWAKVLNKLDLIRINRRMMIILLAHYQIREFQDPTDKNYSRYVLKLGRGANERVAEWADVIGFAVNDQRIVTEKGKFNAERTRAVGTGKRVIHLEERPAYLAGNRYGLPKTIPLSWDSFETEYRKAIGLTDK